MLPPSLTDGGGDTEVHYGSLSRKTIGMFEAFKFPGCCPGLHCKTLSVESTFFLMKARRHLILLVDSLPMF